MNRVYIYAVVLTLAVMGFLTVRWNLTHASKESTEGIAEGSIEGMKAIDFSLVSIEGNVIRLSDFRGNYVIFAFFATWCTPCRVEAENVRLFQERHPDIPLRVIQIGVDPRETKKDLLDFKLSFGRKDWIVGFDDGTISKAYDVRSFDTTVIVDPEGKIIYRDNGVPISIETLESVIGGA